MVQFTSLRLSGFKSFPDKTELDIAPGLTGVVGPNGCGKSNLLEALRWVMGENSAKRMRGDGMEDVIFNGTDKRSARNIAEVSLLLKNNKGDAPAPYTQLDEIEVTRKIERDYGSNYKINGKNVRARDVQMLFADTVTGANSPAIVSQGRVTQIINSKPQERRMILEESAGISGLYARRHEAEIRLRAAEKNLERMSDLIGSMEGRYGALKRQARQAAKYRALNEKIRHIEIVLAYLEWMTLQVKKRDEDRRFAAAESDVADFLTTVSQLTKTQNVQNEELEPLRRQEIELSAQLQTQKITLQKLEEEQIRAQNLLKETKADIGQTTQELEHERKALADGETLIARLKDEEIQLIESQNGDDENLEKRRAECESLAEKVSLLDKKYTALMEDSAAARAKKESLESKIAQNTKRLDVLRGRLDQSRADLAAKQGEETGDEDGASANVSAITEKIETLNTGFEKLKSEISVLEDKVNPAREQVRDADKAVSDFEAELRFLADLLEGSDTTDSVFDEITAGEGFEIALSRALGDSLQASIDPDSKMFWRENNEILPQDLPSGLSPLLPHVKAPKALHLALSQIGVVDDFESGNAYFGKLLPGQAIVSRDGHYWRWDGLCMRAEARDQNAQLLEQKNKLKALQVKEDGVRKAQSLAQSDLEKALGDLEHKRAEMEKLREERSALERDLSDAKSALNAIAVKRQRHAEECDSLNRLITMTEQDVRILQDSLSEDQKQLKAYQEAEDGADKPDMEVMHAELTDARQAHQDAVRALDRFEQDVRTRKARSRAIADERISAQNRTIRSKDRISTLEKRETELAARLESLQNEPASKGDSRQNLLDKIAEFESAQKRQLERKNTLEIELAETVKGLKTAENALSDAKEKRAAAGAMLSALKEQSEALALSIEEKFNMPPEHLKNASGLDDEALEAQKLEHCRSEREHLIRERDLIGAVNLRADDEAQELEQELGGILNERNDLTQAIEELRGGINKINKEARQRLLAAFDIVNGHFQHLFQTLFAGGKAHLALVDSDDPLGAGLEIFAQPPGKSLQSLSLMSGGEQTLSSIALIFAMFLTNPSPICVLDEIDAPLDDANVDRVCDVLDEMAMRGTTRFLIITHHRLTMARMDRLYGVTMAERGVSQLVSVDLQQSFAFSENGPDAGDVQQTKVA